MQLSILDDEFWSVACKHLRNSDPKMRALMKSTKRERLTELNQNSYEALVKAIIFQQISGAAGDSILKKFKTVYKGKMPSPKRFLSTSKDKVRSAGISPQKYGYLTDLSERINDGRLRFEKFTEMDDESVIMELDEVKGIGRWTAEMFLIFTLGRTNVMPIDDLGLKKAVMRSHGLRKIPSNDRFKQIAKKWHPYCTVASLYLWSSLDNEVTGGTWG